MLILRDAIFRGIDRFSDFERSQGIAPNILAARLRSFLGAGLMHLDMAETAQPRYRLTEKGRDLAPVIVALTTWGDRWAAPNGAPVVFHHGGCGGSVRQAILCEACAEEMPARALATRPGQGAGPALRA